MFVFLFFFVGVGVSNRVRKFTSGHGMHSVIKHEPGVYVHLMCLSDKNVFPLFSFEINTQHFLFSPRFSLFLSKSYAFTSEPNQMLGNYFVPGHLCLKINK